MSLKNAIVIGLALLFCGNFTAVVVAGAVADARGRQIKALKNDLTSLQKQINYYSFVLEKYTQRMREISTNEQKYIDFVDGLSFNVCLPDEYNSLWAAYVSGCADTSAAAGALPAPASAADL